jgi:hypothetical protein
MRLRTQFAIGMIRHRSRRVGSVDLPIVGQVSIHAEDGRALLFPQSGGGLVLDWFAFLAYLRRHGRAVRFCKPSGAVLWGRHHSHGRNWLKLCANPTESYQRGRRSEGWVLCTLPKGVRP